MKKNYLLLSNYNPQKRFCHVLSISTTAMQRFI